MLDFPIFEAEWGADEELLLVEGLELHGVGNWEQISDHIGTKNKEECARHYDLVYVQSEDFPCPKPQADFVAMLNNPDHERLRARQPGYVKKPLPVCPRPPPSAPANHEIAGFMPGRRDFDLEFDNEAEQSVKEMEFAADEPQEEVALKTAMLNIYNTTLNRRTERKNFIFDRNLTDFKKIQAVEKKRPKEEKELYQKMRVFAKMMTATDFELFMQGLLHEQRLRQRISALQEYRRMGLSSFREAHDYDREKLQRANSNKNMGLAGTAPAGRGRPKSISTIDDHSGGIPLFQRPTTPSINAAAANDLFAPRSSSGNIPLSASSITIGMNATSSASSSSTRKQAPPLDIAATEGTDLLSEQEMVLCSNLRLFPRAYLAIKDTLLKEYATKGSLRRRQARSLVKIDVNKTTRIYDFFVEMGWLK